jgi:hypothetical protein
MHQLPSSGCHPLPMVALEHQGTSVREFFKAKPLDLSALEVCLNGDTFVCTRRSV